MLEENPSEVFEAVYNNGTAGLAGTMAVAINDNQNVVVYGPTTLQIVELIVGGSPTGNYRAMLTAPAAEGQYSIVWSEDGSFDADTSFTEDLLVAQDSIVLPSLGGEAGSILCSAWTTAEDVVACCDAEFDSALTGVDAVIVAASEALYLASGKQFPGLCSVTVRPCQTDACMCGIQVLSRGHLVGWDGSCWSGYDCGCRADSRVRLAGYVNEITAVKIDGVVLDPSEYFVYRHSYLTRKNGSRWPWCQSMDLDDTEDGTFSVSYTYGKAPPVLGQLAAKELACELAKSCLLNVECAIPKGVVRMTRQGMTFDRGYFARDIRKGIWNTGMGMVDYFLNAVNPKAIQRQAVVWSPAKSARYARPEAQ